MKAFIFIFIMSSKEETKCFPLNPAATVEVDDEAPSDGNNASIRWDAPLLRVDLGNQQPELTCTPSHVHAPPGTETLAEMRAVE